jgi:bifunctional DNase/RNase
MGFRGLLLIAGIGALACGDSPTEPDPNIPVHVGVVAIDQNDLPVVILEEDEGSRWLPIWIGSSEARSIALAMEEYSPKRPNTHDLAGQLILGLAAELDRVVVTDLKNGTYFATIVLKSSHGTVDVDSRPSDAIAIALRAKAPIFVRNSLLEGERGVERTEARPERRI